MSRHYLVPLADNCTVVAGYDAPTGEFFLSVVDNEIDDDPDSEDDPEIFTYGLNLKEHGTLAGLLAAIPQWAKLPAGLATALENEQQGKAETNRTVRWGT